MSKYVFGPVYSRRLGVSLGINNIPYKFCSYTCIYCQLGRTIRLTVERRMFSNPEEILAEVRNALREARVDYVTFVPDGEPTLDTSLGRAIHLLKSELGVRVAVITNASLLWIEEVRQELMDADYVSVKVDAGRAGTWRRVNRPHPSLDFSRVVEGIIEFSQRYKGVLVTETMLVSGTNDSDEELKYTAAIISRIKPHKAYIATPIRPPAEPWVKPPPSERIAAAYTIYSSYGLRAELLVSSEPPPPVKPGDPKSYILATTLVHPLKLSYVEKLTSEAGADMEKLLEELRGYGVEVVEYMGEKYLVRRPRRGG